MSAFDPQSALSQTESLVGLFKVLPGSDLFSCRPALKLSSENSETTFT